ncbi:hypothetical protein ANOM_006249 [Aspergillus nomiae NRRL 13137]|uniref:Enoyl-CoA hydratase/isomerase family protein n=1 Tax=Aspergillus nomiae NRRL (strain ATCC 15546 / NRRL 13137 / CBS 260.88 / M93) TaxID=1509407 RepID=A0A0L1J2W2_ASPN3|nr:uncharacterized protein ANOM_006249 [Aspergillus nomiae NRRL 13137]KNG86089.1 hypothetical protein ANOM_006249 [Aspergillus nomiae NRRL 13137]
MCASKNDALFDEIHLSDNAKPLIDPNTCATFVVRLLHHARQLWPQAQLPIVRTFAFYLTLLEPEGAGTMASATPRNVQVLAGKCNTFLRLLSLPCRQGPFTSASIQQQAQFELLRAMARNQPVLPVTRRGYQAIIAVQLAHKKTLAERQSAELKAPSWPPWKEEKLGLDSQRGIEGLRSRAMRVMSQMKEAGYAHSRWEEVSSIFAGWDTDKSPTIQTRTLARQPWRLRGRVGNAGHHAIWEARIRATRTVREAWACFLSYRDQGLPPRGSIYTAMAEKLIYRRNALYSNFDQTSHALPGDALETFPEPLSARDLIYVHTEPPTLDELLTQMLSDGIRPQARFLSLLLRHAPSFRSGLEYLSCSDLSNEQIRALCTVWAHKSVYDEQSRKVVNELPAHLFSAFVYFLCKFSTFGELSARHARDAFPIILGSSQMAQGETSTLFSQDEYLGNGKEYRHPKTLAHAIELLRVRHPGSPQAWVFVLSALNKDRVTSRFPNMNRNIQRVIAWHEILEITGRMEYHDIQLGLQGFQTLCSGFSRAVNAGIQSLDAVEEALEVVGNAANQGKLAYIGLACPRFEDMVQNGLRGLKDQFDRLVLPDSKTPSLFGSGRPSSDNATDAQVILPPLLHVPSPAVLHAFVRSLGLAEDYDGLLSLLRWMSQYAAPLKEASDEYLNGAVMMRRTLVAMRLFLEGYQERQSWESLRWTASAAQARGLRGYEHTSEVSPEDSERLSFSDPNLQEAYDIVTATHVWGPWPSDEEVEEYYANHLYHSKMPPRLPLLHTLRQPSVLSVRVRVTRFSTAADDAVIQTQQIPAPGSGNIRVLLLNRPKARNAISKNLLDSLDKHVQSISAEGGTGPTRALVIASNVDSAFCAGADLKERVNMTKEETNEFLSKLRGTFRDLAGLPVPTISAVSSTALGGGLELALCTHLRVFGSSSIVGLPETRLAIIWGGRHVRLPGIVGVNRARDLILTGRRVSGAESYFMGLCDRLVEILPEEEQKEGAAREKVLRESIKLAMDICEGGPIAIKQALQAVNDFQKGEVAENKAYDGVVETEDRFEALRAFAEKRKPAFRGR